MKKALVIAIALVMGLGVTLFAAGTLSGTWDLSVALLPAVGADTTLTVEYTIGGWVFASVSDFNDANGFAKQKFTADGTLGAFTFSSEMVFLPGGWVDERNHQYTVVQTPSLACPIYDKTVTHKTGPVMDYSKSTLSVSIAGIDGELLMYQRGATHDIFETWDLIDPATLNPTGWYVWCYNSGKELGTGFRTKIEGTAGGMTFTSYTYFNLTEAWRWHDLVTNEPEMTPRGIFSIVNDCGLGFNKEIVTVKDAPLCCDMTFDAALTIGCNGFEKLYLYTTGVPFFSGIKLSPWITFTVDKKEFGFAGTLDVPTGCVTVTPAFQWTEKEGHNGIPNTLDGITIKDITLTCKLDEGSSFGASVVLYELTDNAYYTIDGPNAVYKVHDWGGNIGAWYLCLPSEKYFAWEKFDFSFSGLSCCANEKDKYTIDATVYFGKGYKIVSYTLGAEEPSPHMPGTPKPEAGCFKYTPVYGDEFQLDTLFGWMMTEVSASVPVSSDISLTLDMSVSFQGFEDLSVGFSFQF